MNQAAEGEIVHFDNVGLRYGTDREVLSDLSFTLYPGSFYFLTGASGAGKTSLLKLLYLALRPSRGMVRMFGADAITLPREQMPALRRRIGVVSQATAPGGSTRRRCSTGPSQADCSIRTGAPSGPEASRSNSQKGWK